MRDPAHPRPTEVWLPDGSLLLVHIDPPIRARDDVATLIADWLMRMPAGPRASDALVRGVRALGLEVTLRRTAGRTTIHVSDRATRRALPAAASTAGAGLAGT